MLPEKRPDTAPAAEVPAEPQTDPRDPDDAALGVVLDGAVEVQLRRRVQLLVDSLGVVEPDGRTALGPAVQREVEAGVRFSQSVPAGELPQPQLSRVPQRVLRAARSEEFVLDVVQ